MASAPVPVVEFHYDIVCPYAYIAFTRLPSLASHTNCKIIYRPTLLGGIYRATQAPQGKDGSASDVFNASKRSVSSRSLARTLRRFRIPLKTPKEHPRRSVEALRLLWSLDDPDQRRAVTERLFRAYWVDGLNIADTEILLSLTRDVLKQFPRDSSAHELNASAFADKTVRSLLEEATADAVTRGASGVPAFWLPAEQWKDDTNIPRTGRLYWGQDRLHFVHLSLLKLSNRWPPSTSPLSLLPHCRPIRTLTKHQQVKLEFWFDFSSPWAYLGWTILARLQRQFGPNLLIEMKPMLLGAVFRAVGAPMLPASAVSEQKRAYGRLDLLDWDRFWREVDESEGLAGEHMPVKWPTVFPIRSPNMLRCAIVEPSCTPVLYRARWALDMNMSDDRVLAKVLDDAGFHGEELLSLARMWNVKEALTANTQTAVDMGICGAPTFRVLRRGTDGGEWTQAGDFVWGQDEIAVVDDLIMGWDEERGDELAVARPVSYGQSRM